MKTPTGAPNSRPQSRYVKHGFQTIVQRFNASVQRHPDQLALVAGGQQLTYQTLDTLSDTLACQLLQRQLPPEALVPLLCTRSAEAIIGMLGVLKTGCAYVPVIPDYPNSRIDYILGETQAPVILCETATASQAQAFGVPVLNISKLPEETLPFTPPEITPEHLAYVLYTSGSTGRPKGVMIDHFCVDNQICGFQEYAPLPAGFNGLSLSPFVFDASVWEIYLPLFFDGTLHLIDTHFVVELDAFIDFLEEKPIHSCYLPASLLPPLTQKLQQRPPLPVKRVLTGAEPIKQRVWDQFQASIPGLELINIYGPTETTVGATYYKSGANTPPDGRVPIGEPVAGYTLYLVDDQGKFCQPGETGEIWVAGPGVGRGYFKPTPENKGRYTTNPFDPDGGRLYKTGDLAHYLPDGNLVFDRRKDQQVKVRGHRIELGEVEAVMEQVPNLLEAVAITREDTDGNNRLIGYFRIAKGAIVSAEDIRQAMARKVPAYMIPTQLIALDDFPRTPNGKIDRRNLPEAPAEEKRTRVHPETPTEVALLSIWQQVLQSGNISTTDSFFDLGGHSLLALQLISNISERMGYHLTLKQLYDAPTVQRLARQLNQQTKQADGLPPIQKLKTGPVFPLSSAQKRLWFIEQATQGSSAYNIPFEFTLKGTLDTDALKMAFNLLAARHNALRSSFHAKDGIPELRISESLRVPLQQLDIRQSNQPEKTVQEWSANFRQFNFDLESPPLIKLGLLRLKDDAWHLFFCIHHIISDASSIDLLMREWSWLYGKLLQKQAPEQPSDPYQYTDFILWQQQLWEQGGLQPQLDYWQQELTGAPSFLRLPADYKRPDATTFEGEAAIRFLPADLSGDLELHARQAGVSRSTLMFTGFAALLQQYSGQEDFVIGVPVANRTQKATEKMQGFFINMLPIRIRATHTTSLAGLTMQIHQRMIEALSNQDAPFDLLLQQVKIQRIPGINPLFQAMFNFQNAYDGNFGLQGLEVTPLGYHNEVAQFDLTLFISQDQGRTKCTFEYNTALFHAERIERLADHYINMLRQILDEPQVAIAQAKYLSEEEHRALTEKPEPLPETLTPIIRRFEAAAAQYPNRTALVFQQESLSFKALNERANQLAHHLLSYALPKGARVGILLPRSADLMIALLAVQKAGCSYLPLDPDHPAKRLKLILEDARPEIILTTEGLKEQLQGLNTKALAYEGLKGQLFDLATDNPDSNPLQPEDELYLIYTSGSTGRPKGVSIGNLSVSNYLESLNDRPGITPEDRFYAITTVSFDIAVMELYWPLLNGAQVILAGREATLDPRLMAHELEQYDVTLMQGTPATWKMLLQDGWSGKANLQALSGGEALDKKLAEELLGRCAAVWNFYGPTETTVYSAIHKVSKRDVAPGPTSLVPVGFPVRHNWLYVLNEALCPVPAGVAGEVYIGGCSLAKGYLHLPELTGERFIPNPFVPGTKMYKTGDRGFFHLSGELEFIERLDHQVKIRGFRIELAEIEQVLQEHPDISASVVQPIIRQQGTPELHAYLVPSGAQSINWAEVRPYLQEHLPAYMVPAGMTLLEALPKTPNGKVDRKQLPEPLPETEKADQALPANDTESKVLDLFREVLAMKQISVTDDFFELGGHSLLAVSLMAKIEGFFGKRLPLASLFQYGSAREIARLLADETKANSGWQSLVSIKASGNRTPLYIVHGAGLNVLLFNALSKYMHPDQPVYGLQAKGMNGTDEPLYNMEAIADYYLEQILAHQPEGPYAIAGFSFGGFVAFEMGRKLLEMGKTAAFVGLFDSVALPPKPAGRWQRMAQVLAFNLKFALSTSPRDTLRLWGKKLKTIRYELKYRFLQNKDYAGVFEGLEDEVPDYQKQVQHAKYIALNSYQQQPCPIKVHLFKAQKQTFFIADPDHYDWQHYALKGVEVIEVPGEHSEIFAPPNEAVFARRLQQALEQSVAMATRKNEIVE